MPWLLFQVSAFSYNFLRCVTGRTLWKLSEIRNVYKTIIDILKVKFSVDLFFSSVFFAPSAFVCRYIKWTFMPGLPCDISFEFQSQSNICLLLFSLYFPPRCRRRCLHSFNITNALSVSISMKYFFSVRKLCSMNFSFAPLTRFSPSSCQRCVW